MSLSRLHGLTIAAPGEGIPGARPGGSAPADLAINFGPEAAAQAQGAPALKMLPAPAGGWMFRVEGTAAYWMREGREIRVSPLLPMTAPKLWLFLLGSALGMALHQRGLHTLHGATLAQGDAAIAFVGDQGAGKSTLAVTLGRAGATALGDDTAAVWPGAEVWPGPADFKLWRETAAQLEMPGRGPVSDMVDKVYVENPGHAPDWPHRLGAVVEIAFGPPEAEISLDVIEGLAAIDLIARHAYRPEYIALLGREAQHFAQAAALAERTRVWRLTRPRELSRSGEVAAWLLNEWPRLTRPVKDGTC
ncbi:MAG: hypothetical protein AAGI70_04165 [Pseudomonadota bacterium]